MINLTQVSQTPILAPQDGAAPLVPEQPGAEFSEVLALLTQVEPIRSAPILSHQPVPPRPVAGPSGQEAASTSPDLAPAAPCGQADSVELPPQDQPRSRHVVEKQAGTRLTADQPPADGVLDGPPVQLLPAIPAVSLTAAACAQEPVLPPEALAADRVERPSSGHAAPLPMPGPRPILTQDPPTPMPQPDHLAAGTPTVPAERSSPTNAPDHPLPAPMPQIRASVQDRPFPGAASQTRAAAGPAAPAFPVQEVSEPPALAPASPPASPQVTSPAIRASAAPAAGTAQAPMAPTKPSRDQQGATLTQAVGTESTAWAEPLPKGREPDPVIAAARPQPSAAPATLPAEPALPPSLFQAAPAQGAERALPQAPAPDMRRASLTQPVAKAPAAEASARPAWPVQVEVAPSDEVPNASPQVPEAPSLPPLALLPKGAMPVARLRVAPVTEARPVPSAGTPYQSLTPAQAMSRFQSMLNESASPIMAPLPQAATPETRPVPQPGADPLSRRGGASLHAAQSPAPDSATRAAPLLLAGGQPPDVQPEEVGSRLAGSVPLTMVAPEDSRPPETVALPPVLTKAPQNLRPGQMVAAGPAPQVDPPTEPSLAPDSPAALPDLAIARDARLGPAAAGLTKEPATMSPAVLPPAQAAPQFGQSPRSQTVSAAVGPVKRAGRSDEDLPGTRRVLSAPERLAPVEAKPVTTTPLPSDRPAAPQATLPQEDRSPTLRALPLTVQGRSWAEAVADERPDRGEAAPAASPAGAPVRAVRADLAAKGAPVAPEKAMTTSSLMTEPPPLPEPGLIAPKVLPQARNGVPGDLLPDATTLAPAAVVEALGPAKITRSASDVPRPRMSALGRDPAPSVTDRPMAGRLVPDRPVPDPLKPESLKSDPLKSDRQKPDRAVPAEQPATFANLSAHPRSHARQDLPQAEVSTARPTVASQPTDPPRAEPLRPDPVPMPPHAAAAAPSAAAPHLPTAERVHHALPKTFPAHVAHSVVTSGQNRAELILEPAELGRLRFDLITQGDQVQVTLSAERPETLDLLRRHSEDLKQEFRAAGLDSGTLSFSQWGGGEAANGPAVLPEEDLDEAVPLPAILAPSPLRPPVSGTGLDLRL